MLGKFNLEGIPPAPRGVPQIEVTFDVDANGILNVTAMDKATSKSNKITITNEKGRLSKEDIEKMVSEAERFKDEDEKIKKKIEAKNGLETYCFQMKNTLNDEKLKEKFTEDDRRLIEDTTKDTLMWIEGHLDAELEVYQEKQKELEGKFNPIMVRIYKDVGGQGGQEGYQQQQQEQPKASADDLD
jgi:heat shock protein 1/8